MIQGELWKLNYQEIVDFIETRHFNSSKYRIVGPMMLNWLKHDHKLLNAGKMKTDRVEIFDELLALSEKCKRKNQYE